MIGLVSLGDDYPIRRVADGGWFGYSFFGLVLDCVFFCDGWCG